MKTFCIPWKSTWVQGMVSLRFLNFSVHRVTVIWPKPFVVSIVAETWSPTHSDLVKRLDAAFKAIGDAGNLGCL